LTRFVYQFPTPHHAARPKRLQHGKLPVIELWKGNALGYAVEFLVFINFGHKRIRYTQSKELAFRLNPFSTIALLRPFETALCQAFFATPMPLPA
jgi:hypothetical protein